MEEIGDDCRNVTGQVDPATIPFIKVIALSMINLAVVLGNSLVIVAVVTTRKLRTVTNIYIVSLACADLMLGVAVLPFSISLEVVDTWLWGNIWCSIWLAIDVLLCTASILSLVAISLDRYVAVTHPIRYPTIMSPARGRYLVSSVWILSFVICLPPLIGWNDGSQSSKGDANMSQNLTISSSTDASNYLKDHGRDFSLNSTAYSLFDDMFSNVSSLYNSSSNCITNDYPTCELTPTKGYRIYASMGSFFIPMLIMAFFYFRIYLTALQTAASIRKGVLTMRTSNELAQQNGYAEEEFHLRVHRGGSNSLSRYPSSKNYDWHRASQRQNNGDGSKSPRLGGTRENRSPVTTPNLRESNGRAHLIVKSDALNSDPEHSITWHTNIFRPVAEHLRRSFRRKYTNNTEVTELQVLKQTNGNELTKPKDPDIKSEDSSSWSPVRALKRSPRRCKLLIRENRSVSVKGHARKFKREAKAAKTLAIIVGAFIICWFPFFTIYLVGAFCHSCVSEIVFAVFFWLGYCNSALNPCIYALFARDFRSAFTRLVFCQRRKRFTQAARADYVTGNRNRLTPPVHENDSASDY